MKLCKDNYATGVCLAIVSALGFSFKAILIKLAYAVPQSAPVDAVTLLTLRMVFALPFFLWFAHSSRKTDNAYKLQDWITILILGLVGYYCASIFDFIGLCYISTGLERVVLFTYPTMTFLLESVIFKRKIRFYEWIAITCCYAGIALVFVHDLNRGPQQGSVLSGSCLVLLSAICYAFYLVGGSGIITKYGAIRFASSALTISCLAVCVHFMLTHSISAFIQPLNVYLLALLMALISTVMPAFTLAAAIQRIGGASSALIGSLGPILTIWLGWLLLEEPLSILQLEGAALVIGGVVVIGRKGRREPSSHTPVSGTLISR